jgi:WD40 repeat protein
MIVYYRTFNPTTHACVFNASLEFQNRFQVDHVQDICANPVVEKQFALRTPTTIGIWNIETTGGGIVWTADYCATAMCFNLRGDRLFTGDAHGAVCQWNLVKGQKLIISPGGPSEQPIRCIAMKGNDLVTGDRRLRIWNVTDTPNTAECTEVPVASPIGAHVTAMTVVGDIIAYGVANDVVIVDGATTRSAKLDEEVSCLRLTEDQTKLFVGGANSIHVLDFASGTVFATQPQPLPHQALRGFELSPDGLSLLSFNNAPSGNEAKSWDLSASEPTIKWSPSRGSPQCLAFHPAGDVVVGCGKHLVMGSKAAGPNYSELIWEMSAVIRCVKFDASCDFLACGLDNGVVVVLQWKSAGDVKEFKGHNRSVWSVSFWPKSTTSKRIVASASDDGAVCVWNLDPAEESVREPVYRWGPKGNPTRTVNALAWSPDGTMLFLGTGSGCVIRLKFPRAADGVFEEPVELPNDRVFDSPVTFLQIAKSPKFEVVAGALGGHMVALSGELVLLRTYETHKTPVQFGAISPDNQVLISGDESGIYFSKFQVATLSHVLQTEANRWAQAELDESGRRLAAIVNKEVWFMDMTHRMPGPKARKFPSTVSFIQDVGPYFFASDGLRGTLITFENQQNGEVLEHGEVLHRWEWDRPATRFQISGTTLRYSIDVEEHEEDLGFNAVAKFEGSQERILRTLPPMHRPPDTKDASNNTEQPFVPSDSSPELANIQHAFRELSEQYSELKEKYSELKEQCAQQKQALEDALAFTGTNTTESAPGAQFEGTQDNRLTALVPEFDLKQLDRSAFQVNGKEPLGCGSHGTVCKATLLVPLGRHAKGHSVAVKRVSSANPRDVNAFLQEVLYAMVIRHPNILTIDYWSQSEDPDRILQYYLIMSLVDPGSLRKVFETRDDLGPGMGGKLGWKNFFKVACGVAEALYHLSTRPVPIVHRDLKPDNILIDRDFYPRVCDFGLAKWELEQSPVTRIPLSSSGACGTYSYMSPEALRGESTKPSTDVYSFGCILWELLHGRNPQTGTIDQILNAAKAEAADGLLVSDDAVPKPLADLIKQCTVPSPGKRPSAKDVCAVLQTEAEKCAKNFAPYNVMS